MEWRPITGWNMAKLEQKLQEITETPEIQTRTGVTTSVVEDFVETRNDRIVSVSIIPFIRARTIEIDAPSKVAQTTSSSLTELEWTNM